MFRLRGLRRGECAPPVHGDADRRSLRVQRRRAGSLPAEAPLAEPVQENLGSLPLENFLSERFVFLNYFALAPNSSHGVGPSIQQLLRIVARHLFATRKNSQ